MECVLLLTAAKHCPSSAEQWRCRPMQAYFSCIHSSKACQFCFAVDGVGVGCRRSLCLLSTGPDVQNEHPHCQRCMRAVAISAKPLRKSLLAVLQTRHAQLNTLQYSLLKVRPRGCLGDCWACVRPAGCCPVSELVLEPSCLARAAQELLCVERCALRVQSMGQHDLLP